MLAPAAPPAPTGAAEKVTELPPEPTVLDVGALPAESMDPLAQPSNPSEVASER